jgi:rubrerythrin
MTSPRSSYDVFEMAIGMEKIGKDFYEALSQVCDDPKVRQFCAVAAGDEAKHRATFQFMRDQWAQTVKANRVTPEVAEELAALAKGRIQPDPKDVRKVAIGGNLADALKLAMYMEQDAISFYGELCVRMPDAAKAIQGIVEEEKRHLANLRVMAL